jgi:hypothetical protein
MKTLEIISELNSLPEPHSMTDSMIARRLSVEPKTIIRWRSSGEKMTEVIRCALAYILLEQRAAMKAAQELLRTE